jgi:hypothetical protein
MTDKEIDDKFSVVQNFIMIQIILTLLLICVIAATGLENRANTEKARTQLENISSQLEIFQHAIPYDPVRKKRIDAEIRGNFNEFGLGRWSRGIN